MVKLYRPPSGPGHGDSIRLLLIVDQDRLDSIEVVNSPPLTGARGHGGNRMTAVVTIDAPAPLYHVEAEAIGNGFRRAANRRSQQATGTVFPMTPLLVSTFHR